MQITFNSIFSSLIFIAFIILISIALYPNWIFKAVAKVLNRDFSHIGSGYESVEKQSRTDNQENKPKELLHGMFRD